MLSIAAGDLNGDGIPDIVSINNDSHFRSLSVLLGNPPPAGGTFAPAVNTQAPGGYPIVVATADLDEDGVDEVALIHHDASTISFWRCAEPPNEGSLVQFHSISTETGVKSMDFRDFNGDGHLDIAAPNHFLGLLSIALGNGDGTFQPIQTYTGVQGAWAVDSGDFNGDGVPDVVVANAFAGSASVFIGRPPPDSGTFLPAVTFSVGPEAYSIAVGDFDFDGLSDFAISVRNPTRVRVYYSRPGGFYLPLVTFDGVGGPLIARDFNGDGLDDLLIGGSGVRIAHSRGAGGFGDPVLVSFIPGPVAEADFDGDGRSDFACAATYDRFVNVHLNRLCPADFDCSGSSTISDIFAFLLAWFSDSLSADFDHSGHLNDTDILLYLSQWFSGCP